MPGVPNFGSYLGHPQSRVHAPEWGRRLIFSSTRATYGIPDTLPIGERAIQHSTNPYGRSKMFAEQMILDFVRAHHLQAVILQYFNACGSDVDGDLGENHQPETHLIPRALMAAAGQMPLLDVFGADYPTPDSTSIRDYVYVSDLALLAPRHPVSGRETAVVPIGIGRGFSVREVVDATTRATKLAVPVRYCARRADNANHLCLSPIQH